MLPALFSSSVTQSTGFQFVGRMERECEFVDIEYNLYNTTDTLCKHSFLVLIEIIIEISSDYN